MSKSLSSKYHQENQERLQKKARKRYQNISNEKKEKATIWSWTLQKFLRKQENKLVEYRKEYRMRKNTLL